MKWLFPAVLLLACADPAPPAPVREVPARPAPTAGPLPAGPPSGLLPGVSAVVAGRHVGAVTSTAWTPDGALLATGSWDGTTRLFDAAGTLLHTLLGPTEDIEGLAFSPDGTRLAAVSRNSNARIWRVSDGEPVADLRDHTDSVESVVWSPDGTRLYTGSWDGRIRVWDAATGTSQTAISAHHEGIFALAVAADGRIASGSSDKHVKIWSPDGDLLAHLDPHDGPVYSAAWSPDGRWLVTGSRDRTAAIHDVDAGTRKHVLGHDEHVLVVAFIDDTTVVTAGWDGRGRFWNAATGQPIEASGPWTVAGYEGAVRLAVPAGR